MKILNTRKKTLFDGDQEELFSKEYSLKCSSCQKPVGFNPSDFKPMSNLPAQFLSKVLPNLKSVKMIVLGDSKFYKVDDISLKYLDLTCQNCGSKYVGLFGLGEYQPARFMLIQAALVSVG